MGVIYKINNVLTDQFYVGSAVKWKRRRWEHWSSLKSNTHHCKRLQEAWNQYGEDAFEFEIVEEVSDDKLLTIEDMYLQQNAGQDHCYNTALSTRISAATQLEIREKISNSLKLGYASGEYEHPRLGKKHNDETKLLISVKRKGKHGGSNHYRYGKTVSDEVRKKIGDTQRGVKKETRVYTQEGLEKVRETMKRNAKEQEPLAIAEVISKFPAAVTDKYDFTNAVYTGALNRITGCVCSAHGEFSQYAAQFRKGSGCPKCGAELRAMNKGKQMKEYWQTDEGRDKFLVNRKNKKLDKQ